MPVLKRCQFAKLSRLVQAVNTVEVLLVVLGSGV
jgi:hypothetical protein